MKKIFYISIIAVFAIVSCDKFLTEKPQSDFYRENTETSELVSAYKSAEDAQSELNGVYALFKTDIYEMIRFLVGDVMTDNCYVGGDGVAEEEFDDLKLTSTNVQVGYMWSQYYAIAGSATNVIENVKLMPEGSITDAERKRIIAEASFARAWVYFDIVRLWGDAPMTLELVPAITADNLEKWYPVMYPARSSADNIYEQILRDLSEENIAALESKSCGAHLATKGAAYGLLAKVYATRGAKASRDWQKVADYCDLVSEEGYGLVENFDDLWTVSGKQSKEGIFELYFSNVAEMHNWAYWVLLTDVSGSVTVTWRRYCTPTHDIVAKFDKTKDKRYASSIYWASVPYNTYWSAANYPLAYKIRQKESDIILMRYADILLLKAEALVEQNKIADAIEIVNLVRTRAGIEGLSQTMSQVDARLAVENERQLELFLEGHRWFDLIRNDRMEEVMKQAHDKEGNLLFKDIPEFRRLLPIPQEQIDLNELLTQNPGY